MVKKGMVTHAQTALSAIQTATKAIVLVVTIFVECMYASLKKIYLSRMIKAPPLIGEREKTVSVVRLDSPTVSDEVSVSPARE